jgi:hypothetical protein
MSVQHFVVPLLDAQSGTHVSVAAALKVSLKQQTLYLAAFGLLLTLDLVQGELQSERGGQPSLQGTELLPGPEPGDIGEGDRRIPGERLNETGGIREAGQKRKRKQ